MNEFYDNSSVSCNDKEEEDWVNIQNDLKNNGITKQQLEELINKMKLIE
jgi:hypothetical protein